MIPDYQALMRRYDLICQRLVRENLYTAACTLVSPRDASITGANEKMSEITSLKSPLVAFAGHIAAEAARKE